MYAVKDIVQAPCFKKLGPTMFREKNLQKIDSIQLQVWAQRGLIPVCKETQHKCENNTTNERLPNLKIISSFLLWS